VHLSAICIGAWQLSPSFHREYQSFLGSEMKAHTSEQNRVAQQRKSRANELVKETVTSSATQPGHLELGTFL